MAVAVDIRLRSIEEHIRTRHGKDRKPTPTEVFIIADAVEDVVNYIKRRWPVDTGTSRDRWTYQLLFNAGELVIVIENPMYYAEYVHNRGGTPEDPLWSRLVPEAWNAHKVQMLQALRAEIDKTERVIDERRRRQQAPQDRSVGLMDLVRNPDLVDFFEGLFGG
jgi:hypothetical protein